MAPPCDFSYLDEFFLWFQGISFCPTVRFIEGPTRTWGVETAVGPARLLNGEDQEIIAESDEFQNSCYGNLDLCSGGFSVTFWLRVDSDSYKTLLLSEGRSAQNRTVVIEQLQTTGLRAHVYTRESVWIITGGSDILRIGDWNYVAFTWSKSASITMFVNGEQCRSCQNERRADNNPRRVTRYSVGQQLSGGFSRFSMQELRFWNEKLSTNDIQRHFFKGQAYAFTRDKIFYPVVPFPSPSNYVFMGNPVTIAGHVGLGTAFNKSNQRIQLGEYSERCLGDLSSCQDGFTLSFWIRPNANPEVQCAISNGGETTGNVGLSFCYIYQGESLDATAQVRTTDQVWSASNPNVNIASDSWNNVVMTWRPDQGLFLYINGQSVEQNATSNRQTPGTVQNMFTLGSGQDGYYMDGDLDEVYFWRMFMDPTEVTSLFSSGFHYHFPMDEIIESTLTAELPATTFGNPSIVQDGRYNGALKLNNDQTVEVINNRSTCFGNLDLCSQGHSVSLWLRLSDVNCGRYIYSNGGEKDSSVGVALRYIPGTGLMAFIRTGSRSWNVTVNPSPSLSSDTWYHVLLSWSASDGLWLYVNGQLLATDPVGSMRTSPPLTYVTRFYIGRPVDISSSSACSSSLDLDQMEVWNRFQFPQTTGLFAEASSSTSSTIPPTSGLISTVAPPDCDYSYLDILSVRFEAINFCIEVKFVNRPTSTWGVPAASGPARVLDGEDQEITIRSPYFNRTCYGAIELCQNGFSFTLWLRVPDDRTRTLIASSAPGRIVRLRQVPGQGLAATVSSDRKQWTVTGGRDIFIVGEWNHIGVTWSSDEGLRLYVNSEECTSCQVSSQDIISQQGVDMYRIGRDSEADGLFYTFSIQDLAFWQRLLPLSDVRMQFYKGKVYAYTEDEMHHPVMPFPSPPDYVYTGNPGEVVGHVGKGTRFDGQSSIRLGEYANVCEPSTCPNGFTLSFWMRWAKKDGSQCVISSSSEKQSDVIISFCFIRQNSTMQAAAEVRASTFKWEAMHAIKLFENAWNNVVITWHRDKGLFLYVNDNEGPVVRDALPTVVTPSRENVDAAFYLAKSFDGQQTLAADLDEVYFWQYFMESVKVAELYISGFHFQFPMDTIVGTRLLADRPATVLGNPNITTGVYNNSLSLGPGQTVEVDNDLSACFGDLAKCTQGHSVALWLRLNNAYCSRYVYSNGGETASSRGVALRYVAGKGLLAYARDKNRTWTVTANTDPPLTSYTWYHVLVTWSSFDGLRLYVDNKLIGSDSDGTESVSSPGPSKFYLGRPTKSDTDGECRTGISVDQMQIWYGVKFPQDIGTPGPVNPGPEPSAVPVGMASDDLTWLIYVVIGAVALIAVLAVVGLVAAHRKSKLATDTGFEKSYMEKENTTRTEFTEMHNVFRY